MVYLYLCEECGEEQEVECKMAEKDEQSCKFCSAPPEKMKQLINTKLKPHVSWSEWRVSGDCCSDS